MVVEKMVPHSDMNKRTALIENTLQVKKKSVWKWFLIKKPLYDISY